MSEIGMPDVSMNPAPVPGDQRTAGESPSTPAKPASEAAEPETLPPIPAYRLRFRLDQASGRVAVTVINKETQEIIREIPPEELLEIAQKLHKYCGILFDETR